MSEVEVQMLLTTTLKPLSEDPEEYVRALEGEIQWWDEDDWVTVGRAQFFVARVVEAGCVGLSPAEVFDGREATACYMHLLDGYIYDGGGLELSTATRRAVGDPDPDCGNILLVDRIEIYPAFRGRNLALHAIELGITHLGDGCRFAAMKPYPLQFEAGALKHQPWATKMGMDELTRDRQAATQALVKHYRRVGFRKVRGTELMVRNLELPLQGSLPSTKGRLKGGLKRVQS